MAPNTQDTPDKETPSDGPGGTRPRWKGWVAKSALMLGSLLFSLLLGEGMVRLYIGYQSGWTTTDRKVVWDRAVREHDPDIGVRNVANVTATCRGPEFTYEVTINGQGMRMDYDVPFEKPAGLRRILLVGDSFAFGAGVAAEESFGELIGRQLDNVEVINLSVSGTGTDQQLLLYRKMGAQFDAELVILGYMTHHIWRNGAKYKSHFGGQMSQKPQFVLEDGELVLTNVPVPRASTRKDADQIAKEERAGLRILPLTWKRFISENSVLYQFVASRGSHAAHRILKPNADPIPEYTEGHPSWEVTKALLEQFAVEVRNNGSELIVVMIPTAPYVYRDHLDVRPHEMVMATCDSFQIGGLDLLGPFRENAKAGEGNLYYMMDGHWTASGHKLAAAEISTYLGNRYDMFETRQGRGMHE